MCSRLGRKHLNGSFPLIPVDNRLAPVEFDAFSIATALDITHRHQAGAIDVNQDKLYKCTLGHSRRGGWTIIQREMALRFSTSSNNGVHAVTPLDPKHTLKQEAAKLRPL